VLLAPFDVGISPRLPVFEVLTHALVLLVASAEDVLDGEVN
jgi:hypothetical protein